jgi:NitT/TauT family transport system permease protein
MGLSDRVRGALDPFVGALHPLPKIAVLPLLLVIFGIGDLPLILIIAAGVTFPMLINTMAGVSQIDPIHLDVARIHRAGRWMVVRRVVIPAAAPSVLAGLRLALNTALLIAIAVEMVAASSGLGEMIWMSWTTFRIENIYVAVFTTIAFGLGVNLLITLLTRIWIPWQRREAR